MPKQALPAWRDHPPVGHVPPFLFGLFRLPGVPRALKWGPTGIAGGSSCAPVRLSYQPRPSRRMYGLTSAFLLPAARKRASGVWDAQLFSEFILGQLMPDLLGYLCLILAHLVDIATTAPELSITIFELQLTELLIYHQAALSFHISDKRRYTYLSYALTSLCHPL